MGMGVREGVWIKAVERRVWQRRIVERLRGLKRVERWSI